MPEAEQLVEQAVLAAGLRVRYAQPHRHYHTLAHVEHVLHQADLLTADFDVDVLPVRLAAWFHDAVYAPGRDDNEERSAFLARDTVELIGGAPELGREVARLVLLTRDHLPPPDDDAGALLSDADLSVLGGSPTEYAAYAAGVRAEFALVPQDTFRSGRAKVLRRFLDRAEIFHTPAAHKNWESTARTNVEREIVALENGES